MDDSTPPPLETAGVLDPEESGVFEFLVQALLRSFLDHSYWDVEKVGCAVAFIQGVPTVRFDTEGFDCGFVSFWLEANDPESREHDDRFGYVEFCRDEIVEAMNADREGHLRHPVLLWLSMVSETYRAVRWSLPTDVLVGLVEQTPRRQTSY